MVVYADILFLIDSSMDFLTLFLCGKCTHRRMSVPRLCLGAGLGAAGSVLLLFLPQHRILTLLSGILLSCLMTAAAFGLMNTPMAFVRQCILVWGCGALAGGILTMIMSLGMPVYEAIPENHTYPSIFLGTTVICILFVRLFTFRRHIQTVDICIRRGYRSVVVRALTDSGNLMTDPLSGRPVLLVSSAVLDQLYSSVRDIAEAAKKYRVRIIPSTSAGGEKILYGVLPDSVIINGTEKDTVLVVEDVSAEHYGGFGALCPLSLI